MTCLTKWGNGLELDPGRSVGDKAAGSELEEMGHRGASEGWMQSEERPVRPGTRGLTVGAGDLCPRAARAGVLRDPAHSSMKGEHGLCPRLL